MAVKAQASADLAHFENFDLGPIKVRPSLRKIIGHSGDEFVEPQVIRVLIGFAQNPGVVLSRDDLIDLCWGGQVITDNAVTRVISLLRKTLKSVSHGSINLETIPRVGYRIIFDGIESNPDQFIEPQSIKKHEFGEIINVNEIALSAKKVLELPSIGVIPLRNMTGDKNNEYFVDGITEDIITALSRFHEFRTASRSLTFAHRDAWNNPSEAGKVLDLQYMLTGSVRQDGDRIRVSVELTHCSSNRQFWRESFDRNLGSQFDVQEDLSRSVAAILFPALRHAEVEHARACMNPTAYDLYLQALPHMWAGSKVGIIQAISLLRQSLEHGESATTMCALSFSLLNAPTLGALSSDDAFPEAFRLARLALEADSLDSFTHATYSTVLSVVSNDPQQVGLHAEEAVKLNPSSAYAWGALGVSRCLIGEFEEGLAGLQMAMKLSPHDIVSYFWLTFAAAANFAMERFDQGASTARAALLHNPNYGTAHRLLAANLVMLGQVREAKEVVTKRNVDQKASLQEIRSMGLFRQAPVMDRYVRALQRCGMS